MLYFCREKLNLCLTNTLILMKRLLLFFMSVMAFAGMTVAQDIYSSGYYTNSWGSSTAAVYKNGTKLYESSPQNDSFSRESSDVDFYNGDVYWVVNSMNRESGEYNWADIKKNGTTYLNSPSGQGRHIFDLCRTLSSLYSVGVQTINEVPTAVRYQGSDANPQQLGNGSYESAAYSIVYLAGNGNYLFACGYQYSNSSTYHGVIWKGTSVLHNFSNGTKLFSIACFNGMLYSVGTAVENSQTLLKVWETDPITGSTTVKYTLNSSSYEIPSRFSIMIESGDIWVAGINGTCDKIYKNGVEVYSTTGWFTSVCANTDGVYYVGEQGSAGKIWKDGSVLYSLNDCKRLLSVFVPEAECVDSDVRSLPFFEGFENGNTSLPCWTIIDEDGNNGSAMSYWHRIGKRMVGGMTGDYCARHASNTDNLQKGWLVTPRLFLQPGRDDTKLTFKSWVNQPFYRKVYVSTNPDPTNLSSYVEVHNEQQSEGWGSVTVNLNDYQGQAIYIAFKYIGTLNTSWLIDDVSVTEQWSPSSSAYSVPYVFSFNNWNIQSTYWYIMDYDMSGGNKHWQYNTSEQCAYHPWGQQGVSQYGCLVSPNINLPAGHDYVLKFKTKISSTGSNMSNNIWINLDGTGTPDPAEAYLTKIWEDNNFPTSWTEVEVPLTAYAGHDISFSFEYHGTYAHNWYIKDVRVEEAIAQYTITANANNAAWGTVSGGGTYNAGATCTLTATPASGYQFQSWKKNGAVVSTSPSYSFEVTESATYTAHFGEIPINYYTISTNVTPAGAGMVDGGGTYQEGSTITLTAMAEIGYSFDQWNDGNTDNPRTITVMADATYTAQFTQDTYTISVYANPTDGGTVNGGGSNYHYGDNAILEATPADGYEFQGWSDGSNENPHTVLVMGDATYMATFSEVGATYYTVTTGISPDGAGTVNGGGTYEEGTSIILTAVANTGYSFERWNDGSTQNPRTVIVDNNMSFTAIFTQNQYTITVLANPTTGGTVSGGGSYAYGSTATLRATPYSGYEFVGWSDGSNQNPHNVTVTGNATYTAIFSEVGNIYYTVSAQASPVGSGTVSGTGSFPQGSSTTLEATANAGYEFGRWNDGSTQNPRTVTVNNNMSFTAFFTAKQYTILGVASPEDGGYVRGGGNYAYGAIATLRAISNNGYSFVRWSDGVVANPRNITVTEDATYTAIFGAQGGETFTLTVTANDPTLGSVSGNGTYPAGIEVQINAYPNANATFVKWNDGNTDNPRAVTMDSDKSFEAEFAEIQTYTITVASANPEMGQAYGGGSFFANETVEISAVPFSGYVFTSWTDGNTSNPRTITVTGNATYTAQFAEDAVITHTVTLICNTSEGTVSGGGVYVHGTEAILFAFPNDNVMFDKWNDGNTDNPRTIVVNSDITLVAFFKTTGVDENENSLYTLYPNPAKESIRIIGIEANTSVEIYNSLGELVKVVSANPDSEIGIGNLASGIYLVRFGNVSLRFVKTL